MPDLTPGLGIKLTKEDQDILRVSSTVVSGRSLFATWSDLAAHPGTAAGQVAEVPTSDAGTHTDPVVAGTVDNSGVFRWSASPAGWERIADVDAVSASADAAAAAASASAVAVSVGLGLHAESEFGLADSAGNFVPLASAAGYEHSFTLADCDTIVHYGDSITEATYVLKDKAWVSIISNLSPYRHINQGVSGNKTANILERIADNRQTIVAGVSWVEDILGLTAHAANNARFAVLMSWANETPASWVQNAPKIIELLKANGAQPVIMSEFLGAADASEWDQQLVLPNIARKYGADYIDVRYADDELALLDGPFKTGGHPGTRTGAIYVSRMAEWLQTVPPPRRSIKLYNVRSTVTVGSVADLVFDNPDALAAKFKEISVGHLYIATAEQDRFEELNQHGFTGARQNDQYNALQTGNELTLTNYALLRVAVPGHARSLEGVGVELGTNATEIYVLDHFAANTVNTDVPMGAWVAAPIDGRVVRVGREMLGKAMRGNELCLLLHKSGGVTVARPVVHYSGAADLEARAVRSHGSPGAELLTTQRTHSLTGWTTAGSPATVVPFDLPYGAPRIPGSTSPITGATEITSANTIGQALALSATARDFATYRLRVWARYWPKPYLDNSLSGYGFPSGQVLDRSGSAVFADSLIQADTFDFRTLRLKTAVNAAGVGAPNDYERQDRLVGLYWTPIDFIIAIPSAAHAGTLNFNLSCPDGTIQIGKVSLREVSEYVDRC